MEGKEQHVWMGSYGIGPARIAAAAIEQYADEHGISWPRAIAPWDVHVVALGKGDEELAAAAALAAEVEATGLSVLLDDRPLRPGEKFADAELLGCPLRLTVGKRALESGTAEVQVRRGLESRDGIPLQGGADAVAELWRSLP
jgi:prolyl-tRNA synthetase